MAVDRACDRAVEVIIIAPDGESVLNVHELAEKAWQSVINTSRLGDRAPLAALDVTVHAEQYILDRY